VNRVARVLVAEDEAGVREVVVRALTGRGHAVEAVADGGAALEALAARPFDVLLADIVMPRLDGVALALKASKDYPALAVVLMTGYSEARARAHNLAFLAHGVIEKPFELGALCEAVEAALARHHPTG